MKQLFHFYLPRSLCLFFRDTKPMAALKPSLLFVRRSGSSFCSACLAFDLGTFVAVQFSWFGYTPIDFDGASMLMVFVIGETQPLFPILGQDKKPPFPGGLKMRRFCCSAKPQKMSRDFTQMLLRLVGGWWGAG